VRILIASDHYPPFIGGAHRQTQLVSRELYKRGHSVSVATVWQPSLPSLEDDDGVQVHRLRQLRTLFTKDPRDHNQRHQPPFPDPVTVWGLRRLFRELKPEVVHSHGWFSYSCAVALLGMDIPLLISGRDYGYSCATRTLLFNDKLCDGPALVKCLGCSASFYGAPKGFAAVFSLCVSRPWLRRKVSAIHSVSGFVQEVVERDFYGNRRDQLESAGGPILESVIPSFLMDQEETPSDPAFLERLPDSPYILFVGGLQPRKGLGELLAAYMQLIAPPPLVLIGYATGDMPKSYPQGVVVLLDVPHPAVMQAWEHCLFGVMPSVWPDPSPGVVREAFSKGKTVIGTSLGGTPEMIINGETGLLVQAGDVPQLAKAMQRLIDDTALREKLSQAALLKSKFYQAEIIVPRFELLYRRLIETYHQHAIQA
jgi:glycosyltransferase involved in cell wall biosynthesis